MEGEQEFSPQVDCGKGDVAPDSDESEVPYWLIREAARSVCKITYNVSSNEGKDQCGNINQFNGSGFLCSLRVNNTNRSGLMTNHHVLGGASFPLQPSHRTKPVTDEPCASNSFKTSFFDNESENVSLSFTITTSKDIDYVFTDEWLDISFIQFSQQVCDKLYKEGLAFRPLSGDVLPEIEQAIFIPQFPGGGDLKIHSDRVHNVIRDGIRFTHTVSTKGGSSGSPIFAIKSANLMFPVWVLGVHRAGSEHDRLNEAVTIRSVVDSIRKDICHEEYKTLHEAMKNFDFDQLFSIIDGLFKKNVVDLLLKFSFDLGDAVPKNVEEPLKMAHFAASIGSIALLKDLATRSISSGLKGCRTDSLGRTVLHVAALSGQVSAFKYCLTAINSNMADVDLNGDTVLHLSAKYDQVEIVKEIMACEDIAKLLFLKNKAGQTAFHLAVEKNSQGVLTFFLSSLRQDLKTKLLVHLDNNGYTPFLTAVRAGSTTVVERLLSERRESFDDRDYYGCHAIHLAAMYCGRPMIEFLTKIRGRSILEAEDRMGQSVLLRGVIGVCADQAPRDNIGYLLQYGEVKSAINNGNIYGQTPLHIAATAGKRDVVAILLEAGALLRSFDVNQEAPIHYAADKGHDKLVALMLDKDPELLEMSNNSGATILYKAANKGQLGVVELLKERKANFFARDGNGFTIAHIAVQNSHVDVISMLFDNKETRKYFSAVDNTNSTPIFYAATVGAVDSINVLFGKVDSYKNESDQEEDIIGLETLGQFSCTALMSAVVNGQVEAFKLLATRSKRSAIAFKGQTIAHLAAKYSDKILEALFKDADKTEGKRLLLTACEANFLPFHDAITFGKLAALKTMCRYAEKWGCKDELIASFKKSVHPLLLAASLGQLPIVNYLLDYQGFSLKLEDKEGNTAMHEAAKNGKLDVIKGLLQRPGRVYEMLQDQNKKGETPIYLAAAGGHFKVLQEMHIYASNKLRRPSGIDGMDFSKMTILHVAAKNGHADVFEFILETNIIDLFAGDKDEKTALHYAATNGHIKIVEIILNSLNNDKRLQVAMLAKRDIRGATAFLLAVEGGQFDVVEMLLRRSASCINEKDNDGNGPTWYAKRCQSEFKSIAMVAVLQHQLAKQS